jgi:putative membrane protein
MHDFFLRAAGTVVHRPYVFVFLSVFLILAAARVGWLRTILFTVTAWCVAFAAEYSSTRNGIPFGMYHYIDSTRDRELWLSNVPVWDSLSFSFLCYLGFTLAVTYHAPLVIGDRDMGVADTQSIRSSGRVWLVGTVLMALLDVVIDPLTVRGERWFLGKIYYYPEGGIYFGVPLSNFVGWLVVGGVSIRLFQEIERRLNRLGFCARPAFRLPMVVPLEIGLYLGVLLFNLGLTFWIGEPLLGTIGILLYLPVVVLFGSRLADPRHRARVDDLWAHAADFPYSPLAAKLRR